MRGKKRAKIENAVEECEKEMWGMGIWRKWIVPPGKSGIIQARVLLLYLASFLCKHTKKMNNGSSSQRSPLHRLQYESCFLGFSSTILILGSFDCKCFIYNNDNKTCTQNTHTHTRVLRYPEFYSSSQYSPIMAICACSMFVFFPLESTFFPNEFLYQILSFGGVCVNFNAISTYIKHK